MTNKAMRSFSNKHFDSILIGVLYLIGLLSLYNDSDHIKRGRPYHYSTTVMVRCYVVRIWLGLDSNNTLRNHFMVQNAYNQKVMKACGLDRVPDRRTFDRRFKKVPAQQAVCKMGKMFVADGLADASTVCVDGTKIHAKKRIVWHNKDRKLGILPWSGIDVDARWVKKWGRWLYGYGLHMACSAGKLRVPLSAAFATANVHDSQMYRCLVDDLPGGVRQVAADLGYDDHKLYEYSKSKGIQLFCPIRAKKHTSEERRELVRLCQSDVAREAYRKRATSVEPLFGSIKECFCLDEVPVRGLENARSWVLMCVHLYQLAVYYNCVRGEENPTHVKMMLRN